MGLLCPPVHPPDSLLHTAFALGIFGGFLEANVEFLCWWHLQSFGVCVAPSPAVPLFMAPLGKNFPPTLAKVLIKHIPTKLFFWKFLSKSLRDTNGGHLKMVISVIFHSFWLGQGSQRLLKMCFPLLRFQFRDQLPVPAEMAPDQAQAEEI